MSILQLTQSNHKIITLGAISVAASLAWACGQKPAEAPPAEPAAAEGAEPSAADETPPAAAAKRKAFAAMDKAERIGYMKDTVTPTMKALWAEAGAKTDDFGCKTCHGAGAQNGSFKMPNEGLPKLDVSDGLADEKKEHPEAVKFMMEKVVPQMAALLDEEPYNPETHQGFGCLECHTVASK